MVYVIRRRQDDYYLQNCEGLNLWSSELSESCYLTKEQVQKFQAFVPHLNEYLVYTILNPKRGENIDFSD